MKNIILSYINKISMDNVNDFAYKNGITLSTHELNILYSILKNNYEDILAGKDENIMKYLKENISSNNYDKIINMYNIYKRKYKNYL